MKLPWDIREFDGSNATAYLRTYNLMAVDCGLVERAKWDRFLAYCAISIISDFESLSGYDNDVCNTFEASLKRYYFDKDPQQKEYQIPYSACAEFYGGLPDRIQDDVQRRLNIDWINTAALDMDSILQEVVNLEK